MKKRIKKFKDKRALKRDTLGSTKVPRITNDNVAEHREEVLSGARKYIYPLQHSKHRIIMITTSILIALVLLFTTMSVLMLYRQQTTSEFMYQVTKVVPFPIARTGNTLIAYENYLFELRHYIHYYETQQQLSFDSEEGKAQLADYKKRALDDVVNHAYVKKIAQEKNIVVSDEEVNNQIRIAREQNRLGSTDAIFEDVLRSYWDWSIDDFRRSLSDELLEQKVTRALDQDTENRAKEALAKLESGADFAEVVKEYSDDLDTKEAGGEFGLVDANNRNVSQQTVDTLFKLDEGQYSDITVTPYRTGYALEIVKNNGKEGESIKGAHIIFMLDDISGVLNDMKDQQPYRLYISLPEADASASYDYSQPIDE